MTALFPVKTLQSITVTPASLADMLVNGTQAVALKVIANYLEGTVATTEEVTAQATVTASAGTYAAGVFTAPATAADVTLTVAFGGQTGTITVKVTAEAPKPTTVTVTALSVAEYQDGTLAVEVKDQFGAVMTSGYTLSYVSGNTNVVTVASTGVVTALGYNSSAATATITVTATPAVAGGTAVTGTGTVTVTQDTTKPTLTAVNVISTKQLNLVFSEKLNATNAVLAGNYKIFYNGEFITLTTSGTANTTTKTVKVDLTLGEDKKTVRMTILSATQSGASVAGFILDGLLEADYRMYLVQGEATGSQVSDLAGNVAIANQNIAFRGTTTPDATAPVITSASYNVDDNKLTINFDKFVKLAAADVDLTKVTLNGITLGASDFGSPTPSDQGSSVTFTITTTKADSIEVATTYVINFAAAAFKDLAGNTNLAQNNVPITYAAKVAPTAATYDENTSILQVTFNREVKVASLTDFSKVSLLDGSTTKVSSLAGAELLTLTNSATIQFKLTQAMKVAFQGATGTAPTAPKVTLAADFATDTLTTPTKNALVTKDVTYTEDTTKPTLTKVEYNADTKRIVFTMSKAVYTGKTYTANITPASLVVYNDTTVLFNVGQILNLNDGNGSKALENIGFAATATLPEIKAAETSTTLTFALSATNDASRIAAIESVSDRSKLKVAIAADAIRDFNYNGIAALEKGTTTDTRATLGYVATEGPSVSSFATNANYGTVVFDKPMGRTSVQAGTFNIYLKSNSAVTMTVDSVRLARDNKTAYVFYKTTSGYNVPVNASEYTAVVTNVVDELNNAIKTANDANKKDATCSTAAVTPKINVTSGTTPDLSVVDNGDGVLGAGDTFTAVFDAPIKFAANATDNQKLGSFLVKNAVDFSGGSARTFGTGATVTISSDYPNEATITLGTSSDIVLGTDYLDINNAGGSVYVQSIATGTNASYYNATTKYKLVAPTAYAAAPKVTAAVYKDTNADGVVNAGDELAITFDQAMDKTYTSVATGCFTLSANSLGTSPLTGAWTADAKTLTLTLAGSPSFVPNATSIKAAGTIKNAWAVAADGSGTAVLITPFDTVAPKLTSAVWTKNAGNLNPNVPEKGDIVTLTFSKPITLAVANVSKFDAGATTLFTGGSAIFDMGDKSAGDATDPSVTKNSPTTVALKIGANPAFVAGTTTLTIRTGGAYMTAGADKIVDAYNNPAITDAAVTITKGTTATTAIVSTSGQFVAAAADANITLITLDTAITLAAALEVKNGAKTIDLNGKTLTTGGYPITVTSNDSTIKNGTIAGALTLAGAGTGLTVKDVTFGAAVTNTSTGAPTYENPTFQNALTAKKALTLKGNIATAAAALTPTEAITLATGAVVTLNAGTTTTALTIASGSTATVGELQITGGGSGATLAITGDKAYVLSGTASTVNVKASINSLGINGDVTTALNIGSASNSAAVTVDALNVGADATGVTCTVAALNVIGASGKGSTVTALRVGHNNQTKAVAVTALTIGAYGTVTTATITGGTAAADADRTATVGTLTATDANATLGTLVVGLNDSNNGIGVITNALAAGTIKAATNVSIFQSGDLAGAIAIPTAYAGTWSSVQKDLTGALTIAGALSGGTITLNAADTVFYVTGAAYLKTTKAAAADAASSTAHVGAGGGTATYTLNPAGTVTVASINGTASAMYFGTAADLSVAGNVLLKASATTAGIVINDKTN